MFELLYIMVEMMIYDGFYVEIEKIHEIPLFPIDDLVIWVNWWKKNIMLLWL